MRDRGIEGWWSWGRTTGVAAVVAAGLLAVAVGLVFAPRPTGLNSGLLSLGSSAHGLLAITLPPLQGESGGDAAPASAGAAPQKPRGINFLKLLVQGGWFMLPLLALSLLVVALTIERSIALAKSRLLPPALVDELGQLSRRPGGLDPRAAYPICQRHPSFASDVLRSVLVKVGRPHAELESALQESAQRGATRLQQPVSWLSLTAAIAPLIGLLGTVWGITQAFYDTTQLDLGQNRAEALSAGIYVALVTTIAGLSIAIPATVLAHLFENRIIRCAHDVQEMAASLLPQLERYEGQLRFAPDVAGSGAAAPVDSRRSAESAVADSRSSPTRSAAADFSVPLPAPDLRSRGG